VDRLEQKQRLHDVSARIATEITKLEGQNALIKGSGLENEALLNEI
jgi:hypothetical protein